ncbi:VOC family protein [Parapedobacter tibetensis]|uniref:VOC family protein n=1 Tax=Parapedobacter tibetensis TaxID=2972951 RepID=UPI00214D8E5A|nr:VOC family protein [Parapedobacter tibetensis]
MEKIIIYSMSLIVIGLSACNNVKSEQEKAENTQTQRTNNMNNLISIVEIPTTDFPRAVKFYQTILGVAIEEVDMDGTQMGVLPSDGETINVVLVKGDDYKPTTDGAVLYLNAGDDLQPMLDNVEQNGGQVIVPKTEISPEIGYFALFIDTEGNKLGLHSVQ